MHQILVQYESWNSIFDCLFGVGCGLLDGGAYLLKDILDIARKSGDVFVNSGGCPIGSLLHRPSLSMLCITRRFCGSPGADG